MNVLEKRAKLFGDTINLRGDEQNAVRSGGSQRSDALLEGRCNCNNIAVHKEELIERTARISLGSLRKQDNRSRRGILGVAEWIVPVGASPSS